MPDQNIALWLPKRGGRFEVSPAPYTPPGADQVVVRARALAVNPVDGLPGYAYRVVLPWLTFPAIVGSDVAGEVVEVGPGVTRLRPGDRVAGHALGVEKSQNCPAQGAFQHYVVLMQHMVCPIPESLSFERASVLPLALSTAASGMFQKDQLGLTMPSACPADRPETVLVWGGSTSVGSNAIQLARNAGYRVVATASPHNFDYVKSLGAAEAVDYHSPAVVDEIVDRIGGSPLAGTLAITPGSLPPAVKIASRVAGSKRVASARPGPLTQLRARRARHLGVHVSIVWGSTLKDNEVGPAIYTGFLSAALAAGAYRAAPDASVVGDGLARIPAALQQLRDGVSATKLVVTV
jgi:NADPH:quinone reductase-like Zn-dependent oxidoreductase